ncbi:MAG TPA: thiamine pyrophosphate-binding protein [Archangium sp.]|nr:thiamine pyrophosphate-binding protein [Archangium sp.]
MFFRKHCSSACRKNLHHDKGREARVATLGVSRKNPENHADDDGRAVALRRKKRRAANVIVEHLRAAGVRHIFGVTGKAITAVFDATADYDDIEMISARHECGAAFMAYGYAQATRNLGVVCATSGAGTTNLVTGVATAFAASVPLLVLTGQVPTSSFGRNAFQEGTGQGRGIDAVDLFRSITKESILVSSPGHVARAMRHAIRVATTGRMGPVHLNLPLDVTLAEIDNDGVDLRAYLPRGVPSCDDEALARAAEIIAGAKRPVFLLGWGAVFSGADQELVRLAERFRVPVVTTIQGKGGIPSDHPLCVGVLGICGHRVAFEQLRAADVLVAVGTSFSEFSTMSWDESIGAGKQTIQIDIDPEEIGKNYPVSVGLVGDAREVLLRLGARLGEATVAARPFDKGVSPAEWLARAQAESALGADGSAPLKPPRVLREVREATPDDTVFLADSGSHWAWAIHYLPIFRGGRFFPGSNLGSMGVAICSAIGIKLAMPAKPVVCICGDGAFQMNGTEIATARQWGVPVVWVVFNDARFGMSFHSKKHMFGRTVGVELGEVNFAQFAESLGVRGHRVERAGELAKLLPEVLRAGEPAVIDVVIDRDLCPPVGARFSPPRTP